jgi:hypothetical protein
MWAPKKRGALFLFIAGRRLPLGLGRLSCFTAVLCTASLALHVTASLLLDRDLNSRNLQQGAVFKSVALAASWACGTAHVKSCQAECPQRVRSSPSSLTGILPSSRMNLSPRLPSNKQKRPRLPLKKKVICLRLAASQHRAQQKTGTLVGHSTRDQKSRI